MRGFTWLAVALTIGAASACGQQSTQEAVTVAESTVATTTATPTAAPAPAGYAATSVLVDETRGSNTVKVTLPQVSGGSAAVRDRFNSGMRTALDDVVGSNSDTTVDDGWVGDERSRVTTLTPHIVGGVAMFNLYATGAAHPSNSVATIVIDAASAAPILFADMWSDPRAAAAQLATLVEEIDDRAAPVEPNPETFANWVPAAEGLHVYVPVAHALGDYLAVTVPWDRVSDLMTPEMKTLLVG